MASHFDITTMATKLQLDEARTGLASFTVANTGDAQVVGEPVVVPQPGASSEWFTIGTALRPYPPAHTEQVSVAVAVPADVPAGSHGFRLRMLLGGGVPEEDFDDSPVVTFDVPEQPMAPLPTPEPEPRRFPWWIVAVIGVIIVVAVIAVGAFAFLNRDDPGRLVFRSNNNGSGSVVCDLEAREGDYPLAAQDGCTDNAARSLVMQGVAAQMEVDVFGSPNCIASTDWAEIETQEAVSAHIVGTFEADAVGPPVSVDYRTLSGPWIDIDAIEAERPEVIVAVGDGSSRSASNIDDLAQEVEGAGGEVVASDVMATELSTDEFATLLEDAVDQGAGQVVVDTTTMSSERLESLAEVATRFEDLDILWPGTSAPEGLDGKVSCVSVSRASG